MLAGNDTVPISLRRVVGMRCIECPVVIETLLVMSGTWQAGAAVQLQLAQPSVFLTSSHVSGHVM